VSTRAPFYTAADDVLWDTADGGDGDGMVEPWAK
jgi:hypothetical protein